MLVEQKVHAVDGLFPVRRFDRRGGRYIIVMDRLATGKGKRGESVVNLRFQYLISMPEGNVKVSAPRQTMCAALGWCDPAWTEPV